MPDYEVFIGVQNDVTGKRFEPGETITTEDFPEAVIAEWVEQGVLERQEPPAPSGSPAPQVEEKA